MDYMPITRKDIELLVAEEYLSDVNIYDDRFECGEYTIRYDEIKDYTIEINKKGRKIIFLLKNPMYSPYVSIKEKKKNG